jgi:hypothetical protein
VFSHTPGAGLHKDVECLYRHLRRKKFSGVVHRNLNANETDVGVGMRFHLASRVKAHKTHYAHICTFALSGRFAQLVCRNVVVQTSKQKIFCERRVTKQGRTRNFRILWGPDKTERHAIGRCQDPRS